ncbi:hypothetical protein EYF80_021457 [Liparis tanakae]|uniref:Uncharacterized protein n=1 Tax=Liparis tanakae TaxID=230148 RepID=A0A4Z2HSL6_9TELE|nr:hypothetical protein EYF80_021457 [Liparis tanakae]
MTPELIPVGGSTEVTDPVYLKQLPWIQPFLCCGWSPMSWSVVTPIQRWYKVLKKLSNLCLLLMKKSKRTLEKEKGCLLHTIRGRRRMLGPLQHYS